jgi:hypothetical protein
VKEPGHAQGLGAEAPSPRAARFTGRICRDPGAELRHLFAQKRRQPPCSPEIHGQRRVRGAPPAAGDNRPGPPPPGPPGLPSWPSFWPAPGRRTRGGPADDAVRDEAPRLR